MNFKDLYITLEKNKYYVFSINDLLLFFPDEKRENLKKLLFRWKRKGWIYSLKRGLFELIYPKDFAITDMYIANRVYCPSYVSLETALSHYSIIPEVSMAVTSISPKPTRRFKNKHGLFIYRTVMPSLFTGYYVEKQGDFNIFIAEPEKALVDYVYFKTYRSKRIDLAEQRFDKKAILDLDQKKLNKYTKMYDINLKELLNACL